MSEVENLFAKHANKRKSEQQVLADSVSEEVTADGAKVKQDILSEVEDNQILVFSKSYCPFCRQAKMALRSVPNLEFKVIELDDGAHKGWQGEIAKVAKTKAVKEAEHNNTMSVPQIFIKRQYVGGAEDLADMFTDNRLSEMLGRKLY